MLNVATIVTPPEDIADRMGLNLGLILTFAAFKITVAGDTPRVGYLTVLDKCVACLSPSRIIPHLDELQI